MADVQRHRWGDTHPTRYAVDSSTVIAIGDLVYLDTDDVKPASSYTYGASLVNTQRDFAEVFCGVSADASASGDTDDITVYADGVFEFPCASATFEVGDYIGVDDNGDGDELTPQQVIAVTDASAAIGIVAQRESAATTTVFVRLFSRYTNLRPGSIAVSLDDALLSDNATLGFGTDDDVTAGWSTTDTALQFLPSADDTGAIHVGDGTTDMDVKIFMGAAATYVLFDNASQLVQFEGTNLQIMDDDQLIFGDDDDVTIEYDEDGNDNLLVSGAEVVFDSGIEISDDQSITLGDDDDATIVYDETTDDALEITCSNGITLSGALTVDGDETDNGMNKDPETDNENGFLTVTISGTSYEIPCYDVA